MYRFLFTAFVLFSFSAWGQNEVDALRYSWTGFGGSARYMGLSGAMNGVGGDLSVIATNPAGLARFTKSDFTISFGYSDQDTKSVFNSTSSDNNKTNFTVTQFGFIAASAGDEGSDWKSVQFAVSYNKLAGYSQRFKAEGMNTSSSLLDVFTNEAEGIPEEYLLDDLPFTAGLAYWAYLIDPDDTVYHTYTNQVTPAGVYQERTINRSGGLNETGISLSGNYMDKVYLGITIGIPSIRFSETSVHTETLSDTSLQKFDFRQELNTRGLGINAKVGIIYLPKEWLRIGLALHTASAISMSDQWNSEAHSYFDNGDEYHEESIEGFFNYKLKTPGRILGSIGIILLKNGLIDLEYEMVNYTRAMLKPHNRDNTGYSFSAENSAITGNYTATSNYKAGAEWRIKPVLVRAGYALYGSPFKSGTAFSSAQKQSYSFGLGYRNDRFYIDAAWVNTSWNEDYYFYSPESIPPAAVTTTTSQVVMSAGLRF